MNPFKDLIKYTYATLIRPIVLMTTNGNRTKWSALFV